MLGSETSPAGAQEALCSSSVRSPAASLPSPSRLLGIGWVVEEHAQLDAAVAVLREVVRLPVPRIEVRSGVVRREQDQRVEKREERLTILVLESREAVARPLGLPV